MSRPHGPAVAEPELERLRWETELEQLRSAHADSASTASARFAELNREADDAAAAYIRKLDEAQAQLGETDAALSALCAARAEVMASQAERISVLEAQVANLRLSARAAGAGQQTTCEAYWGPCAWKERTAVRKHARVLALHCVLNARLRARR